MEHRLNPLLVLLSVVWFRNKLTLGNLRSTSWTVTHDEGLREFKRAQVSFDLIIKV